MILVWAGTQVLTPKVCVRLWKSTTDTLLILSASLQQRGSWLYTMFYVTCMSLWNQKSGPGKRALSVTSGYVLLCIENSSCRATPSVKRSTAIFWSVQERTKCKQSGSSQWNASWHWALLCEFLTKDNMVLHLHLPYSLDLLPADFYLFSKIKWQLVRRCFNTAFEIKSKLQNGSCLTKNDFWAGSKSDRITGTGVSTCKVEVEDGKT